MKLLTQKIKKNLPAPYSTDGQHGERKIAVKFFTPWSHWTWYVFEGSEVDGGDYQFFGLVCGHEKELGYFCLSELESLSGPGGLKVERDFSFDDGDQSLEDVEPEFCERLWGNGK